MHYGYPKLFFFFVIVYLSVSCIKSKKIQRLVTAFRKIDAFACLKTHQTNGFLLFENIDIDKNWKFGPLHLFGGIGRKTFGKSGFGRCAFHYSPSNCPFFAQSTNRCAPISSIHFLSKMLNNSHFLILFLFLVFFCSSSAQNSNIPQKFFGAFLYDRSDNLDAYLAAKGFDAATRQQFKMPKLTRIFYARSPGIYRMMVGTGVQGSKWVEGSKKNADWTFSLGNEFQEKHWDGNQHKILFTYNPMSGRLTERHKVLGDQSPPEEFVYEINGEGNLDLHVVFKGVELIHHFIRTD